MTENDYTALSSAQTLPTAAAANIAADSQGQKKRRNDREGRHKQPNPAQDGRIGPAADEIENLLSEQDADGQHLDCRV